VPDQSALANKIISYCKTIPSSQDALAACCKEILQQYKFECVFIAYSSKPEEGPVPLAFSGKEEIVDNCLYRLGIEERIALSKMPLKAYSDITGKPLFNKSGSLRIQKPNGGVFLVYHRPKQDFLLLGCAHQDPRAYDQELLDALTNLWKPCQEILCETVHRTKSAVKETTPAPAVVTKGGATAETQSNPTADTVKKPSEEGSATVPEFEKMDHPPARPVILVDEVTRLFNKDYFEECLAIEVERAKRYSRHVSLVFLSVTPLEGMAEKMDENKVATQIAEILNKSLRRVDIICRLEKNKYGIILPDTANNTYGIIAKRVFKFFKQIMGDVAPVFLNISASTYPKHAGNHLLLFENAEKLLLQAQGVGPNKAVLPE
jgi:diguanylate cyclase (GGDEF)-like protein